MGFNGDLMGFNGIYPLVFSNEIDGFTNQLLVISRLLTLATLVEINELEYGCMVCMSMSIHVSRTKHEVIPVPRTLGLCRGRSTHTYSLLLLLRCNAATRLRYLLLLLPRFQTFAVAMLRKIYSKEWDKSDPRIHESMIFK